MLEIIVGQTEAYDESKQEFVQVGGTALQLEHSLASLSKWEQKWEKPFIDADKTDDQIVDYVRCMVLTPGFTEEILASMTTADFATINAYISAKMTATWFAKSDKKVTGKEVITAEIIYYYMVALNIPLEWEHRHLNSLLTLIQVINEKNAPEKEKKKMTPAELAARNRRLNDERRAKYNTAG